MANPHREDSSDIFELAAMCSRWLEHGTDFEEASANDTIEDLSSSSSIVTDHTATPDSKASWKTELTTPVTLIEHSRVPDLIIAKFTQELVHSDLPTVSKKAFSDLVRDMESLPIFLLSDDRLSPQIRRDVKTHAYAIKSRLGDALERVQSQIDKIVELKTLAPFNVFPKPEDLWCNYRQKAFLIVRHTSPPCVTECRLIRKLAFVFNEIVYKPFLQRLKRHRFHPDIEDAINASYDTALSLVHGYRQWCRAMKDVRQNHMLPVLRAILDSPALMKNIADFEASIEVTKAVTRDAAALRRKSLGTKMARLADTSQYSHGSDLLQSH